MESLSLGTFLCGFRLSKKCGCFVLQLFTPLGPKCAPEKLVDAFTRGAAVLGPLDRFEDVLLHGKGHTLSHIKDITKD